MKFYIFIIITNLLQLLYYYVVGNDIKNILINTGLILLILYISSLFAVKFKNNTFKTHCLKFLSVFLNQIYVYNLIIQYNDPITISINIILYITVLMNINRLFSPI